MNPSITVLTGASRGLGRAMAQALLRPGHHLLGMARQPDPSLAALAAERGAGYTAWAQDLADAPAAAQRLADWLATQAPADIALINNAAALSEPAPLRDPNAPAARSGPPAARRSPRTPSMHTKRLAPPLAVQQKRRGRCCPRPLRKVRTAASGW